MDMYIIEIDFLTIGHYPYQNENIYSIDIEELEVVVVEVAVEQR